MPNIHHVKSKAKNQVVSHDHNQNVDCDIQQGHILCIKSHVVILQLNDLIATPWRPAPSYLYYSKTDCDLEISQIYESKYSCDKI